MRKRWMEDSGVQVSVHVCTWIDCGRQEIRWWREGDRTLSWVICEESGTVEDTLVASRKEQMRVDVVASRERRSWMSSV